jgi:outer membrane lipoprotein SlyB
MRKTIAIASVLMAAAFTGIFSTSAYATDSGDYSGTNTEQEIKQKNVGSGESTNTNCAQNVIDSIAAATVACLEPEIGGIDE